VKAKNIQGVICLVILFLSANQAWSEEWILYSTSTIRDTYYDKSSIKKVDKNIAHLYTKQILSEDGKKKYFSFLENADKAPDNPDRIGYILRLSELDCEKDKVRELSLSIYDNNNNVLYSSPKDVTDSWHDIMPNSAGIQLKEMVCAEADDRQVKSKAKEAVQNLVTKWLNSWQSGDLETYRSCYAADFKSQRMNLDAWVSHKDKIFKKSKNINISIDKLRISIVDNNATVIFTQRYSSSIFQDSGEKKLEFKKVNDEWKIYREIM